jgi:hypothetical protein
MRCISPAPVRILSARSFACIASTEYRTVHTGLIDSIHLYNTIHKLSPSLAREGPHLESIHESIFQYTASTTSRNQWTANGNSHQSPPYRHVY